jgi:hypothetical protein
MKARLTYVALVLAAVISCDVDSFAMAADPSTQIPSDRSRPHRALSPALVNHLVAAVRGGQTADESGPSPVSGTPPTKYRDVYEVGGILIGFDISYGLDPFKKPLIVAYRPYFVTGQGKRSGGWRGKPNANVTHLEAKPGYVVGQVATQGDLSFRNLTVTYMKLDGDRIDTGDFYSSPTYGGPAGSAVPPFGGKGQLIVGTFGEFLFDGSLRNFGGITVLPKP